MNAQKRKVILSVILLVLGILLYIVAMQWNGFAVWYSERIYPWWSTVFAFVFGLFPFSVSEMGAYGLVCGMIVGIVWLVRSVVKRKKTVAQSVKIAGCNVLLVVSVLLFLYVTNCGINYQTTSFVEKENFQESPYTREELIEVCSLLTDEINALEKQIEKDENGNVVIPKDAKAMAAKEMKALGKIYPSLKGFYPEPKELMVSEILSYQQVSGIYLPFTVEANINGDMPEYMKPFVMCHELSHLKGIMREEEANFVAYLACRNSQEPYFQYSGAMSAYYYCMTELRKYDTAKFAEIRQQLCETANRDIKLKNEFWSKYDGVIATVSNKVNDVYLKTNSQGKGVNSYNEVTGLILGLYLKSPEE